MGGCYFKEITVYHWEEYHASTVEHMGSNPEEVLIVLGNYY